MNGLKPIKMPSAKEKVAADRLFISTSETQRGDQVVPGVALGLQD